MVGEIEDEETARLAVQAALSGHLVISTVAAASALAAAHRLIDLDVEPSLLAAVLRGVVGQRLVRRLCPHCSHPSDPDRIASYEALAADGVHVSGAATWREPIGCPQCAQSGYQGRLGLYEIAEMTPDLSRELEERASEEAVTLTARAAGFQSLFDDGYAKARAGLTSLAEVRRAVGGAEPAPSLADA
jgi:general secretion pathway protein E